MSGHTSRWRKNGRATRIAVIPSLNRIAALRSARSRASAADAGGGAQALTNGSPAGRSGVFSQRAGAERLRTGADLNPPNTATFYGGGEAGYTDYPTLVG